MLFCNNENMGAKLGPIFILLQKRGSKGSIPLAN